MASSLFKLVCMAIVCFVLGYSSPKAQAALTCVEVGSLLSPCVSYVNNGGNTVRVECCNGIMTLSDSAHSTHDRQSVCNCIKESIKGIPYNDFNLVLASSLPKKCGVNIPYQKSPSTECSSEVDDLWSINSRCSNQYMNKWLYKPHRGND